MTGLTGLSPVVDAGASPGHVDSISAVCESFTAPSRHFSLSTHPPTLLLERGGTPVTTPHEGGPDDKAHHPCRGSGSGSRGLLKRPRDHRSRSKSECGPES